MEGYTMDCIARQEYERTRGLMAFTITKPNVMHANQSAKWYDFPDGSRFIFYFRGEVAYQNSNREWQAIRTQWERV
jgi:hypothetical protein